MAEGLCAETDPDEFFPDKGGSTATAKRICFACKVRKHCLDYALTTGEPNGVWGGMSERERRRARPAHNARQRATAPLGGPR
ncbi:WhiB family transcriptional regulator [Streptomyces sp. NPDC059949]|uniref:WhiB family transcriptional regulator n=1 Tax=Streptomyces sp. NPDC059949 TaxID=3347013 RepID=UPI0036460D23